MSWDANSESNLAGYNIYHGSSSRSYDVRIDVGNQTSYTVSGLVSDNTYYFALTSYDIDGNESGYSDEAIHSGGGDTNDGDASGGDTNDGGGVTNDDGGVTNDDGGGGGVTEKLNCEYTIFPESPEEETFTSEGGTGSVYISTEDGCEWTATSNNGWIFVISGNSGSGNGTVEYSVSENTRVSSRTHHITIASSTFTVIQDGAKCAYSLSSTEESFTADIGTGSLDVITDGGCERSTVSNEDWITITSGSDGTGGGIVDYEVSENTGDSSRTGTMTISGETFTVTQAAHVSPDIKANNSDGPITIGTDENISIEISLSATDHVGEEADWWLIVSTPSGLEYYYDLDQGVFVPGLAVTYQGVIFDNGPITIFNTSGLDAGTYVCYFGIDLDMDGDFDMDEGLLYLDSVEVTVEEGAGGGGSSLSSPTGLSASVSDNTLTLSWDAVDEAEGYRLYYGYYSREYSGTFDLGNSTSMVFEGVPEGTYYLAITAYAGSDEIGYSSEASVTIH